MADRQPSEWHDDQRDLVRTHGGELRECDEDDLMRRRFAGIYALAMTHLGG